MAQVQLVASLLTAFTSGHESLPLTNSISLGKSHQYTKLEDLYFENGSFIINEAETSDDQPNYVKLHQDLFQIKNVAFDEKQHETFSGISLIFLSDHLMCHFFHFMEHLIGTFTALMELHFDESPNFNHPQINQLFNMKRAIFPNQNGHLCSGKYNINEKILTLLFPQIEIICGDSLNELSKRHKFEHAIISMRIMQFEVVGIECIENESCLWNKMNGEYLDIIKLHNDYFQQFVWFRLRSYLNIKNVIFDRNDKVIKIACISRESSSNRRMTDEVRAKLLNSLHNHYYFGNVDLFKILVLRMEEFEFYEQMRLISECSIIVGVHGNGLTHIAWLGDSDYGINKEQRLVIELLPPYNLKINDYMLQAEMANIFHFQWDTFEGQIVDSSHSFKQCPAHFYRPHRNPNEIISEFTNMNGFFDAMQEIWIHLISDNYEAANAPTIIPKTCVDVNRNDVQKHDICSLQEHHYEYSNGVC